MAFKLSRHALAVAIALCLVLSSAYADLFAYPLSHNQCDSQEDYTILPGVGSEQICTYGDSLLAISAALNIFEETFPETNEEVTLRSLTEYMINNYYFDQCPEGISAAQCLLFAPVEAFLTISNRATLESTSKMVPSEVTCRAASDKEKVIFLRETTGALRLVVGCDGTAPLAVLNTHGRYIDFVESENIREVYVFSMSSSSAVSPNPGLTAPVIPRQYPLFRQCDPKWANRVMGANGSSICKSGCLMSSAAMGLFGHGIPHPNGTRMNPAMLNDWLRKNGGYTPTSDFIQSVMPKICQQQSGKTKPCVAAWPSDAYHKKNDLTIAQVQGFLNRGRVVIANVKNGGHFVLATGWEKTNPDTIYVNDPGAGKPSFSFRNEIVGWRIFDFTGPKTKSITELASEWAKAN